MTTRKSNNRTEAKGKPVKTIDLTAEDVTKSESSATGQEEAVLKPEVSSTSEPSEKLEDKADETKVASDGPKEEAPEVSSIDEKARAAVEDSSGTEEASKSDDTGIGDVEPKDEIPSEQTVGSGDDSGAPPIAPSSTGEAPKSGGLSGGFVGGLLGGVAIVALSYVGLQQGWISLPADTARVDALESNLQKVETSLSQMPQVDVAAIDQKFETLQSKLDGLGAGDAVEAPSGDVVETPVDSNSPVGLQLEALTGRIDELKESVAAIDALSNELLEAKAQLATLQAQTAEQGALIESKAAEQAAKLEEELKAAKDDILSSADRRINDVVVELSNFSDTISTEAKSLRERVTSLEENNLSEKMQSSARMIALARLENAVGSGGDYSLALKTFANVVGDHDAVTALADYASSGAPTVRELAADFRAKYDDILREAEGAGATTLLDKFLISAQSMVKVHSLNGEQKGESLVSRLGVIEFHVKQGELVKAAEEWDALPDAARASKVGADWIEGLKARIAVDAAMDTIRAEFGTGASKSAS